MNKSTRFSYCCSLLLTLLATGNPSWAAALLSDNFDRPNGLITNEFAFWNPANPTSVKSAVWELDSGSFFIQGNAAWTGVPDNVSPNAQSTNGTNSAVFRLITKRKDFGDVSVSVSLLNQGISSTASTPPVAWDGCHIWLRYQSEVNLYYASINRRDNTVIIKKKVPGGPSNGGTYYELSPSVPHAVPYQSWQSVTATVQTNSNGSVTIKLYAGGVLLVSATDNGSIGGSPILAPGRVGIRGDNANLKFDNFSVSDLASTSSNPVPIVSALNPSNAVVVGPAFTLTVNGSAFMSGSVVRWNGQNRTTTFMNSSQLRATIPTSDLAVRGYSQVTVSNPTPGGGISAPKTFTIRLVPNLMSLIPLSISAGGFGLTLTLDGSQFASDSVAQWNGAALMTTFLSTTRLTAAIPASAIGAVGTAVVNVSNPSPGGVSGSQSFTIAPQATTLILTPGDKKIALAWPMMLSPPYTIYYATTSSMSRATAPHITGAISPSIISNLFNGIRYYFVVTQGTGAAETQAFPEASAIPTTALTTGAEPLSGVVALTDLGAARIYPNPWRSNLHAHIPVTFDRLTSNSTVKIFSVAGHWVQTLSAQSGSVAWYLTNASGHKVASGLYLYLITNPQGQKIHGILAVIK